ncbi:MAG: class I SAM-dependent methyltransferase [Terrimicrobiaceae bacterium]|nr:class I SAM-dependent methyltransferase [Terrimicrobiaceae bacterium]
MLSEFEKGISLAIVQLLQLKNILIKRHCLFDVPHLEGNVVAAVDLNLHEQSSTPATLSAAMHAVGHFCANSECMASIYDHPRTYDLEHSDSQPDIRFFQRLVETHRPARILEFACGNGRLTIPMAQTASAWDAVVTGVDSSHAMLESARHAKNASLVQWKEGDVTSGGTGEKYDFIFSGCGSRSHLLTIDDQIAAWNHAFESLASGGRFVVAEVAPRLPDAGRIHAFAKSQRASPGWRFRGRRSAASSLPRDTLLRGYATNEHSLFLRSLFENGESCALCGWLRGARVFPQ